MSTISRRIVVVAEMIFLLIQVVLIKIGVNLFVDSIEEVTIALPRITYFALYICGYKLLWVLLVVTLCWSLRLLFKIDTHKAEIIWYIIIQKSIQIILMLIFMFGLLASFTQMAKSRKPFIHNSGDTIHNTSTMIMAE